MLFAANYLAFSSKTPRVLLLNTSRFAANSTAFCCILQCVLLQNAIQLEAICLIFCDVANTNIEQFSSKKSAKTIVFYQNHRVLPPKRLHIFFLFVQFLGFLSLYFF
jgi:hypothetical protein